jgi:hypothetical protein
VRLRPHSKLTCSLVRGAYTLWARLLLAGNACFCRGRAYIPCIHLLLHGTCTASFIHHECASSLHSHRSSLSGLHRKQAEHSATS